MRLFLGLAFILSAAITTHANSKLLSDKDPAIIQLVKNIEAALTKPTEFEILLLSNPKLNSIKHIKLPPEWSDIPKLEVASALLTEKYRRELLLSRAPSGELWLSQGSFGAVLPPESIKYADGTYDQIFHTHPGRGRAQPSSSDIESNKQKDNNKTSEVINMTGQKCQMLPSGALGPQSVVFVPSKYPANPSAEVNKLDIAIEIQSSLYDYLETLKIYLANNPSEKELVKQEFLKLKNEWKSLTPINHSSIPGAGKITFSQTIQNELDAIK